MGVYGREPTVLRPDKGCTGGPHLAGEQHETCVYCEAWMLEREVESLREQLRGAVAAFEDFIAEVAAPTGRLRLAEHDEADVLYESVRQARATLATLRGQYADAPLRRLATAIEVKEQR